MAKVTGIETVVIIPLLKTNFSHKTVMVNKNGGCKNADVSFLR